MTAAMIKIKPLSVNQAWQGRRYSTKKKKQYEEAVCLLMPSKVDKFDKYRIYLEFGFSSKRSDWDNPIKPFVDCITKKYNIDDALIYEATVRKSIVPKGREYVYFDLREFNED